MKIEIDTQRDSEKEFRAAIALLQTMLGEVTYTKTPPVAEEKQEQMMSMFDLAPTETVVPNEPVETKKESPKIQIFDI
jgi:hypothetical protein